ncbi:CDP-alcohol phosphatidyltransferase family protein [Candidatus Legionella polyplacis]|uniref:CDP-diacylglycerol--glycerol-3-phosphate 3-phosphatidyltransferase n=1 Tax=Candidatus Legionella polyplacis TaxID=2005262 RepID=A0ABZ2GWE7_9GAMM
MKIKLQCIPNLLTFSRLILIIPILICIYKKQYSLTFYLFLTAGLTDTLDGWIARNFNWQSSYGASLDPLADKFLITLSFIALALIKILPWWLVILTILKDTTILLGIIIWFYIIKNKLILKSIIISKINTTLQLLLIIFCLFNLAFHTIFNCIINTIILLTALTTTISNITYIWIWILDTYQTILK